MELRKAHAAPFSFKSQMVRFQEVAAISLSPRAPDSVQGAEKPIHPKTFVKAARPEASCPMISADVKIGSAWITVTGAGSTFRPTSPGVGE